MDEDSPAESLMKGFIIEEVGVMRRHRFVQTSLQCGGK